MGIFISSHCLTSLVILIVACGPYYVKRGLNASAKDIDAWQPALNAQAVMNRNLLPLINFCILKGLLYPQEALGR